MKTAVKQNLYEAMFLVDSSEAASDWSGVNKTIEGMLKRADAEIVSIRKWDERRLAYKIGHKERGTYILCYFRAEGGKVEGVERDVQLSERVMRVLILNAEHMTQEDIKKDTPAMAAEKRQQEILKKAKEKTESVAESAESAEPEEEAEDWEPPEKSLAIDMDMEESSDESDLDDEDMDEQSESDEADDFDDKRENGGTNSEQES